MPFPFTGPFSLGCVCSVTQLYPALCDLMDCSQPDFLVHGISQERILYWVAISYSRGSSWPRDQTCISWVSYIGRPLCHSPWLVKWKSLSCVQLFATPWTMQSIEFSRPEYWNGQPFPSPGDLPQPGTEPISFTPAVTARRLFTTGTTWEAPQVLYTHMF